MGSGALPCSVGWKIHLFCPAQRCQCCLLDPLDANAPPQRLLSHGRVWPLCTEAGPGETAEGGILAMPRNLRWCLQSPSHQDSHVPGTLQIHLDLLCPARGPAATDIVRDLDFLGWSSQCLDDCAGGLCGLRIVKVVCPCDATHWSASVPSQGKAGRECSPFADFPIPFLCLSGKRCRGRCWPHTGRPSPARWGPSSHPREVWSGVGALGTAARTLLAAAQQ